MKENRYYQRYSITDEKGETVQCEIRIDDKTVGLVNFSLGGLCFLSEKTYSEGDIVTIVANLENRGKIELIGKVVRVMEAEKHWSVAVDLSQSYNLRRLPKC